MPIVAHRIQLLPNQRAENYFRQACGTARWVYNWALDEWERITAAGGKPSVNEIDRRFNAIKRDEFPWMFGEDGKLVVSNDVGQRVILKDLKNAFKRFFDNVQQGRRVGNAENPYGYPRRKKKGKGDAFYVVNTGLKIDPDQKRVKISKAGWVRMRDRLRFQGKIMGATVSRAAGKWFISIRVEIPEPTVARNSHGTVGVDLGVSALATLSDGRRIPAPAPLRAALKRLRRLQRRLSRKTEGGSNWRKMKGRTARLHYRIACIRKDALHQLTAYLTRKYDRIGIEDLNVKGMLKNTRLARAIGDVGFGEFRRQMAYKAKRQGAALVIVGRFMPTSKACSGCGAVKEDLTLSDRTFRCDHCGVVLDRDHNAALNIMVLAGGQSVAACGG